MMLESDTTSDLAPADGSGSPRRRKALGAWIAVVAGLLLLALVALGVATTLIASGVLTKFRFAQRGKAKADIAAIENALVEYSQANGGQYPVTLRELVVPDVNGHTYLRGPNIPFDPWGNVYRYDPPRADRSPPIVSCLGKDGLPGGDGEDADIDSRSLNLERRSGATK